MKDGTVKLSGYSKDRFIERFMAEETALEPQARLRLTARAKSTFSSVRVRKAAMVRPRTIAPVKPATQIAPVAAPVSAPLALQAEPAFDAYAVKLVPVFQREGREGLMTRLAGIAQVDHLRQMAKAQQIVLPEALRAGDAAAEAVRAAIVDAVARRIADRRAAAG